MKKIILLASVLFVAACATKPDTAEPVEIRSRPIERPNLILPETSLYRGRPVTWVILTPENAEAKFKELESQGKQTVFFALTVNGYENISLNLSDLMKILQEQRSVIVAYQDYYERADRTIRNHNSTQ